MQNKSSERTYNFIDLFAGIGGFRIALQQLGGECVFSSEWDKAAKETYFQNYGEVPFGDITKSEIKSLIPDKFDVLCAGFPCQPFSIAGVSKKLSLGRETGFEDKTQGTLFFDVCRILKAKRPRAFMLENVKIYNDTAQIKQKISEVEIQTVEKNLTLEFSGMLEARKFTGKIVDAVTGTTLAKRGSNKIKDAFSMVDDTLGLDTRGTIKGVLENGVKGTILNGIGKKK